jgi:hypothetical protein
MTRGLALALLCAVAWSAGAPPAAALESAAGLKQALRRAGRGEATLRYELPGVGGAPRAVHATLALELPDRARIDVASTGEHIVVRADGGEWLQPATRQLVRFPARQAALALMWWRVLLGSEPSARERRLGAGHYEVSLPTSGGQPADSAEVVLDGRGLPARLTLGGGESAVVYRLGAWHFGRARGAQGFRLSAPAGYESVDLP